MTYGLAEQNYDFGGGVARKTGRLIPKDLPSHGNRVWEVTVAPAVEPITVDEVKTFSGIDYPDHDTLLEGFIAAVRVASEEYTGRAFIEQTIQMKMDYWPGTVVELPSPPLISVTKIVTLDEDDAETEYDSDNYYIIAQGSPGKVVLKKSVTAPQNTTRDHGGFLIEFKAGYGDEEDDVPQAIRSGLTVWVASTYATRKIDPKNPPPEARTFLDLYRLGTLIIR